MTAPLPACQWDASAATAVSVSGARLRLRDFVESDWKAILRRYPRLARSAPGRALRVLIP